MSRRLHSLPFAAVQEMVSYKAAWNGVPCDKVDPENTARRWSPVASHTRTTEEVSHSPVENVATRVMLTTPSRIFDCRILVATKPGATKAHPWACA